MHGQLKLDFALLTRIASKELIERELGIVIAVTVGDYLCKWDFTLQNPENPMNNHHNKFKMAD